MRAEPTPIAVFARAPRAGRAKTRLIPALGREGAAELYRAFLIDTLRTVQREQQFSVTVWAASAQDAAELESELGTATRIQADGDLGMRMEAALTAGLERSDCALVVGSDCPTLPSRLLREAVWALAEADVVLGPSIDGGYYLIGVRGEAFPLGPDVRWSTRHALADTLRFAKGRRVAQLRPWYDVDTPEDLRLLRLHLALRPSSAPATARALGLRTPGFFDQA